MPAAKLRSRETSDRAHEGYDLLPLRFLQLDSSKYLLTNLVGQFEFVSREDLRAIVTHQLAPGCDVYRRLLSKHFIMDPSSSVAVDLLAAKYRTRQSHLPNLAALHIFVVTRRCDHQCRYCQVTSRVTASEPLDMTREVAEAAVEFMLACPSPYLKVEFQGGEPLLNFECVKFITETVSERAPKHGKRVEFVVCTNLSLLTPEILEFLRRYRILVSTSLDGPEELHNTNRRLRGGNSYERVTKNMQVCREALGVDSVAALMTATRESLGQARAIIDEYLAQGLTSVFLRPLNPYGYAAKHGAAPWYSVDEWLHFYRESLDYILTLNAGGVPFREEYTAILLRRILSHHCGGFVDLQSPTGSGTAVLAYNYEGGVYASDEARMLAAMGDEIFRLGNVFEDTYEGILGNEFFLGLMAETMAEGVPMCEECAYQPYCGSDPIRHYRTQGDFVGRKPTSDFCRKQMGVLSHLFQLIASDAETLKKLERWL